MRDRDVRSKGFAPLPDGGWLAFRRIGTFDGGMPLLLHRPLGGSMALWGAFADELAREHPVLAFDPRGVGESSALPLGHSTRGMARDAVALLDALRVPRVHLFGLSLGGMVASWTAADAPDRVEDLVLASTLPSARTVSHRILGELGGLACAFLHTGGSAEVALVHRVLSPEFRREHPDEVSAIEAVVRAMPTSRTTLVQLALAAARHDATVTLRGLEVRTLLLAGRRDPLVGRTAERELLHDLPHARLELLDAGHDLSLEAPIETARHVLAFLNEAALDRAPARRPDALPGRRRARALLEPDRAEPPLGLPTTAHAPREFNGAKPRE